MAVKVGQRAREFSLFGTTKNKINISDYKGKNVLLLFFPRYLQAYVQELCTIRGYISRYNNANAEVFGISAGSVYTLRKLKKISSTILHC